MGPGEIAGIVIGCVAGVGIIGALAFFIGRKLWQEKSATSFKRSDIPDGPSESQAGLCHWLPAPGLESGTDTSRQWACIPIQCYRAGGWNRHLLSVGQAYQLNATRVRMPGRAAAPCCTQTQPAATGWPGVCVHVCAQMHSTL